MTLDDLRDEIGIDFEALDQTLAELIALQANLARRNPTVKVIAWIGMFSLSRLFLERLFRDKLK